MGSFCIYCCPCFYSLIIKGRTTGFAAEHCVFHFTLELRCVNIIIIYDVMLITWHSCRTTATQHCWLSSQHCFGVNSAWPGVRNRNSFFFFSNKVSDCPKMSETENTEKPFDFKNKIQDNREGVGALNDKWHFLASQHLISLLWYLHSRNNRYIFFRPIKQWTMIITRYHNCFCSIHVHPHSPLSFHFSSTLVYLFSVGFILFYFLWWTIHIWTFTWPAPMFFEVLIFGSSGTFSKHESFWGFFDFQTTAYYTYSSYTLNYTFLSLLRAIDHN